MEGTKATWFNKCTGFLKNIHDVQSYKLISVKHDSPSIQYIKMLEKIFKEKYIQMKTFTAF